MASEEQQYIRDDRSPSTEAEDKYKHVYEEPSQKDTGEHKVIYPTVKQQPRAIGHSQIDQHQIKQESSSNGKPSLATSYTNQSILQVFNFYRYFNSSFKVIQR